MTLHPLFAGFKDSSPYAVGAALGFSIHIETALGPLPSTLDPLQRERMREGGDLAGFQFAGGWGAPGAHCLMFAKPLTMLAASWWFVGEGEQAVKACINCGHWQRALPSPGALAMLGRYEAADACVASLTGAFAP
jgi:hypothetical protein